MAKGDRYYFTWRETHSQALYFTLYTPLLLHKKTLQLSLSPFLSLPSCKSSARNPAAPQHFKRNQIDTHRILRHRIIFCDFLTPGWNAPTKNKPQLSMSSIKTWPLLPPVRGTRLAWGNPASLSEPVVRTMKRPNAIDKESILPRVELGGSLVLLLYSWPLDFV